MKYFLLLFCFSLSLSTSAQNRSIKVIDESSQAISGAIAIDYLGREYGPSNETGILEIPAEGGSMIQVFREGYYIRIIDLSGKRSDQAPILVRLKSNELNLQEVTVSAKRIPFTDTLRVRDFDFQDTNLLVLGYKYLVLANPEMKLKWSIANERNYRSLERDPRGNLFLLTKDSASQVLIRGELLYFYPPVSIIQYNQYIKPLSAVIGGALVLRNIQEEQMPLPISPFRPGNQGKSMTFPPFHNQGVQFFIYRQGEDPQEFYFSVDTAGVLVAHDAFMDAFNIAAGIERYFDSFGIWQHEKLFDLDQAQKIYRRAYAKDLPIPIFKRKEEYLLFDRFQDKIVVFDQDGIETEAHPFVIDKDFWSPLIVQDYESEELFALKVRRGMVSLQAIEDYGLSSSQKLKLFAKEVKVKGDQIYFIDESNYLVRINRSVP